MERLPSPSTLSVGGRLRRRLAYRECKCDLNGTDEQPNQFTKIKRRREAVRRCVVLPQPHV